MPFVLDDLTRDMPVETFYSLLTNKTNVFYELGNEQGLIIATNVRPYVDAIMHVMFFDRKVRGREDTFVEVMADLFNRARLRRMTMIITQNNDVIRRFAERVGFVLEGTIRQASLYNGRYYDRVVYGLLREEQVNGG